MDAESLPIPDEAMEEYRRTARLRWAAERQRRTARHDVAWTLARQAAELLRRDYAVTRVVVFGSLLDRQRFSLRSDVDLAAWGLTPKNWLRAIGAARALSDDIELNLVDVEMCSPEFLAVIEREGVEV